MNKRKATFRKPEPLTPIGDLTFEFVFGSTAQPTVELADPEICVEPSKGLAPWVAGGPMGKRMALLLKFQSLTETIGAEIECARDPYSWPIEQLGMLATVAHQLEVPSPLFIDSNSIRFSGPTGIGASVTFGENTNRFFSPDISSRLRQGAASALLRWGQWASSQLKYFDRDECRWLTPGEAIELLRLPTKSTAQKYRMYAALLKKLPPTEYRTRGSRRKGREVNEKWWKSVVEILKSKSRSKTDWSDTVDELPDLTTRIAEAKVLSLTKKRKGRK